MESEEELSRVFAEANSAYARYDDPCAFLIDFLDGTCIAVKSHSTAVSSEAWAKLRDWANLAGRGRLLLSGSIAHASLKTAVCRLA